MVARASQASSPVRTPAHAVAAATLDPEIPSLTIEDLGILRSVDYSPDQGIVVTITPTYSGCPAMTEIAADIRARLSRAGFARVTVATQLSPPWTTDWITADGRRKLAAAGIAPPSEARAPQARAPEARAPEARAPEAQAPEARAPEARAHGTRAHGTRATTSPRRGPVPVPLTLSPPPAPSCPRCGSPDTRLTAQFSATACKSLHRCAACGEPFEMVKPI
jgi:ring-1,2-phenylacetyl-CoA epoxidase subunit PaaD